MKTSISTKFFGIIALATLLPLAISILVLQTYGYRHLVKERGIAFQAEASHISDSLNLMVQSQVEEIHDFLTLGRIHLLVEGTNAVIARLSQRQLEVQAKTMDGRWETLSPPEQSWPDCCRTRWQLICRPCADGTRFLPKFF